MTKTDNLRRQRESLYAGLVRVSALDDDLDTLTVDAVQQGLDQALSFVREDVQAYARAEETVLYPALAALFNVHMSSGPLRDHGEITRQFDDLVQSRERAAVRGAVPPELHSQLDALVRLLARHLRQSEDTVLPMLEANLTPKQARTLDERMHAALSGAVAATPRRRGSRLHEDAYATSGVGRPERRVSPGIAGKE